MFNLLKTIALLCLALALTLCKNKPNSVFKNFGNESKNKTSIDTKAIEKIVTIETQIPILGATTKQIYERVNFSSIWHNNHSINVLGESFLELLQNCNRWGINPYQFQYYNMHPAANDFAKRDVEMTQAALIFLSQVAYGSVRTEQIFKNPEHEGFRQQLVKAIYVAIDSQQFETAINVVEPNYFQYHPLKDLISRLTFPQYKPKPLWVFNHQTCNDTLIWHVLRQLGYPLTESQKNHSSIQQVIGSYQKQNKLQITQSINFETYTKLLGDCWLQFSTLELNIERIKQNPPLTSTYVWVNIPAYRLEVVSQGKIIHQTRVVVGSPKTPTPILSSKISHIITYPSWNIPSSIIRQEIIPAMKRDSTYLKKKGYTVTSWVGHALPYSAIFNSNAQNIHFPFNISQPPGNNNALGILKFLFNNSESIYLHDTNARSYFARQYRALSHGCVRVDEPHKLAAMLLDSALVKQMDKQLSNKTQGHIKLTKEVGVYLRYITCAKNSDGSLQTYPDVYLLDALDRKKLAESVLKLPNWVN